MHDARFGVSSRPGQKFQKPTLNISVAGPNEVKPGAVRMELACWAGIAEIALR